MELKDQANIYLLRDRHCLVRYGTTLAQADFLEALRYILYAYSLNDKLDKLWLENMTELVSKNILDSFNFQCDLLFWLSNLLTDEQCLLHAKSQWVYYFMGLVHYQPINGRINLLLDELSRNPGLYLQLIEHDMDENLSRLFGLGGDPLLAQQLKLTLSCFKKAAAMGRPLQIESQLNRLEEMANKGDLTALLIMCMSVVWGRSGAHAMLKCLGGPTSCTFVYTPLLCSESSANSLA
jgi:hypothetical protein